MADSLVETVDSTWLSRDGSDLIEMHDTDVCEKLKELASYITAVEAQKVRKIVSVYRIEIPLSSSTISTMLLSPSVVSDVPLPSSPMSNMPLYPLLNPSSY